MARELDYDPYTDDSEKLKAFIRFHSQKKTRHLSQYEITFLSQIADKLEEDSSKYPIVSKLWSNEEIEACVISYVEMINKEQSGLNYNKSQYNNEVRENFLNNRTKAAVELRMQNISAVFDELGLPWIKGYKPRKNVGNNVKNIIIHYLNQINYLSREKAIPEYVVKARIKYPKAYMKWSQEDDIRLIALVQSGTKTQKITSLLERQPSAIISRINKFDLAKDETVFSNKKLTYWWENREIENYWLEITDRDDLGANLHAPQTNQSGKEFWGYSFVALTQPGDIVFHFDKKKSVIVAYSIVANEPVQEEEIKWAARGTYAKGMIPFRRPGWLRNFSEHHVLERALSVEVMRSKLDEIVKKTDALMIPKPQKKGLYFPFELKSSRPLRPMQGYLFKLPSCMIEIFPELMQAESRPVPKRKFDHDPHEGGFSARLL